MAEERLEIILEADVKGAIANLKGASDALKDLGINGAKNLKQLEAGLAELRKLRAGAETAADLNTINVAIKSLSAQAAALRKPVDDAAAGVAKIGKGAANANPALVNFGRVVQDAPFGLIGIANNIDPLISSFQSLSKSAGGTGGALKALGGALLGPAGIGIAISAVTSALIAFGPEISEAISGLGKFGTAAKDAALKSSEAFKAAELEFDKYVQTVNNSNASIAQQNAALEGANKLLGNYGLQIASISDLQKVGTQIGNIYAQIKQNEAFATALAAEAAKEYAANIANANATGKEAARIATGGFFTKLLAFAQPGNIQALAGGIKAIEKSTETQSLFSKELERSNKKGIELINSLSQITGVTEKTGKATADTKTETDKLTASQKRGNDERARAIALAQAEAAEKAKLLAIAQAEIQRIDDLTARKKLANIAAVSAGQLDTGAGVAGTDVTKRGIDPRITEVSENFKLLQEDAKQTAAIIGNTLGPTIDNVFNALANGDNVFKALGDSLKGLVIELVKAVAKALILQAILTAIAPGAGAVGGAGGGGFIGKLLGSVFGGRAGGGPVTPGGGYIVGENGPEKFYPTQPGMIVPSGGGMGGTLTASISGNSLLFLLNGAARNSRMNFG